jgi:putative pyruvate formate lyase activating enzyme
MWRLRPDALDILENPGVRRALSRYIRVVKGKAFPKFMIDRILHVDFEQGNDVGELFALHDKALLNYMDIEKEIDQGITKLDNASPSQSFLDLKVLLARRIMNDCHFCERGCGVDRLNGKRGYCNSSDAFSVASFFPHLGEEPELVPSGTVFTYGCSIRCIHCQNWDISQWKGNGAYISAKKMADLVEGLKAKGCRNLNMVGGDPTPYASLWLETLRYVETPIATIWNSNSFYSEETAMLLAGFIDLYLLDFLGDLYEKSSASGFIWRIINQGPSIAGT